MPRRGIVHRTGFAPGVAAIGFAIGAGAQLLAPLPGPPLYDGVVNVEPYRFVAPAGGIGAARSAQITLPVTAPTSPTLVVGTPEQPPQAQLIAGPGAFALPPGTTAMTVSISPIDPLAEPALDSTAGTFVGNAYRVSVTTQAGTPILAHADAQVTLALRSPTSGNASVARLANGQWSVLRTESAAVPGSWETAGLMDFGDFVLVGPAGSGGTGSILGAATAGVLLVALAAVVAWWVLGARRR